MAYKKITLSELSEGALEEVFQYELKNVLANIADMNTKGKKPRKIAIYIDLTPASDENRDSLTCEFAVKSTLVSAKPGICNLAMSGFAGEKLELFQETSRTLPLFEDQKTNEIDIKGMLNAAK
ncbi:MAG: hypothetical protein A2015_02175 [Spirochaetes bacterium GWF1_31_7]|nr:MAG: hypothetical protein A2Y30_06025 [Spirochaetes bacterium GWE1_32_154]OHD50722.1 MAG: hypothetical protein A2015_02175 [Spirochaetes bacterium GWF1_31_7]OHD73149.1 MAG: hypothetical protein A2355_05010 [Spirochaetes bacterium RIFOXYB1_FULL_32_8]HBD95058.1 hypothetical protein [Spirochaetia bacterium]HBI38056.1 hypothetical protein [Spirochaetia bacterium]